MKTKPKLLIILLALVLFACTQQNQQKEAESLALSEIESSIEHLEKGFVLASQDEYALDVQDKEVLVQNYQMWLNGPGFMLMNKFRLGETFNDDEKPYWRLARASYIWKAQRMYERFDQGDETLNEEEFQAYEFAALLWEEGAELMKRGYLGERFSDDEIERLWDYRVICEIRICCPTPYRPFDFGIHRFGEEKGPFYIGKEVPDISWMTMEAAMESPFYTDVPTHDLYAVIKPDAVDEFFRYFRGYNKVISTDGREFVEGIFPQSVPGDDRYVRISDFRGKKPVVLFIASSMDTFWGNAVVEAEAIHRAYQGHVEVIWVNISIWDFLIRSKATNNYFKPNAGVELPGHEANHEERARTAKKIYMTYPQLTLHCVLDQDSEQTANYFKSHGGAGETVLVDIDGTIAWHSTYGWGHWFESRPPGRTEEIAWGNAVEKEIHKLLENNGKFDTDHELLKVAKDEVAKSRPPGIKSMYMMNGPITDIDRQNRIITVKARTSTFSVIGRAPDGFQQFNPLQSFTIEVPIETKITCRNVPIDFDKFNVGSIVIGPEIWKMTDGSWLAKKIRLIPTDEIREELPPAVFTGDMYLYGKILEVDTVDKTLRIMRTTVDPGEMKGYRYIKEGGDKVELIKLAKDNFATVEKWVEKDRTPAPYLFDTDDALLIRNGEYVSLSELKAGDFVSVKYAAEDEDMPKPRCAVVRATRVEY